MPRMRLQKEDPEDAHFQRKTDILEKNEGENRGEEQEEEGGGDCCCRWGWARQWGGPCGGTVG